VICYLNSGCVKSREGQIVCMITGMALVDNVQHLGIVGNLDFETCNECWNT
jgi:hypothetical protein